MKNNEFPKLDPITIIVSSFNRKDLLGKTIDFINSRTFYPFRIIVVDNASTDGSVGLLKSLKVQGRIFDHLFLPENIGQSKALNKAFDRLEWWENEKRRPSSDFFITTNEDIFPPMLGQGNCWLRQMVNLLEKNEPEYGGLCQRIQRTPRNFIDEAKDIIPCYKGFPSVFRLMRRSDIRRLGDRPFGRLQKWDGNTSGEKFRTQINKKFGFTTHIYSDHAGFMLENKGFPKDSETFTVAENKLNERNEKPYPDIDPETNVPIKTNHPVDDMEQHKRDISKDIKKEDKIESSFVIPCWFKKGQKGREHKDEVLWWAWKCLERMFELTPREKYEIIMVDNGSDEFSTQDEDGRELSTKDYFAHADVLIKNKKNLGYGPGMGAGIAQARGKYIFCLENDVLPFPGWYEGMLKPFTDIETKDKVGLVQPWSVPFRAKKVALGIKYDDPNLTYDKEMYVWGKEWGAVHATPKYIFDELKRIDGYYFDPRFGLGFSEDKDLYKRIRLLGKETLRSHYGSVFHSTSTSYKHDPKAKERMENNKLILADKYA